MGSSMTAATRLPEQATTAQLNDRVVSVQQMHRRWTAADYAPGTPESPEYEPVALTVTTSVSLSLEDTTAVLFGWGCTPEELADDDTVRLLVADAVLNRGCGEIEEQRCRLGETTLSPDDTAYLTYCRQRASALFGIPSSRNGHALPSPRPVAAPVIRSVAAEVR